MAKLPPSVRWKADNYNHLFEQPTLFYPMVIVLALVPGTGGLDLGLAWTYVAMRVVHSVFQATVNQIRVRFAIFIASSLVLAAIVARAGVLVLG